MPRPHNSIGLGAATGCRPHNKNIADVDSRLRAAQDDIDHERGEVDSCRRRVAVVIISIMAILPPFLMFTLLKRYYVGGLVAGGVKG